jgi:hypothetical protein
MCNASIFFMTSNKQPKHMFQKKQQILIRIATMFLACCLVQHAHAQNVGIGIVNPLDKLDVAGIIRTNGLRINGANILELGFGIADKQTDNGKIGLNVFGEANTLSIVGGGIAANGIDRRIKLWADGGTVFTGGATFNGLVGIFKATPQVELDLRGGQGGVFSSEGDFRIGNETNRLKMGIYTTGVNTGHARIYSSGPAPRLILGLNAIDVIGLLPVNNGTVIIGNGAGVTQYANGYKLNVQGKIVCTELMVKNVAAWPDYVFDDAYPRMPVSALADYIQRHKHLPGIPSAADIEQSGLEVGEMQRKMMEKIEELTLYIIDLEKKMQAFSKGQ